MTTKMIETKKSLKQDNDYISSLIIGKYELIFLYSGGKYVNYYLFMNDTILFSGNDFKPSALHNVDDLQSMLDCLGFLIVQPGDTDNDYFDKYTPVQLDWANSYECETLSSIRQDIEDGESKDYTFINSAK